MATSWETKDNKTFIFHLRKNAKWSNGDPVTADDFVYSFGRVVDPKTASPYAWYIKMTRMKNAASIMQGKKKVSTLGAKALDPLTLEIKLDKAVPYFIKMVAATAMKPVNKRVVEKWGDSWTHAEHFVGNGAFVLKNWVINERIVLVPNEKYWDNSKTVLTKVTYLSLENSESEMNRFFSGEIDITDSIPTEQFKRLQKEHPESLMIKGSLCSYYYSFNTKKPPFNAPRVRKAISYVIDRDVIANIIVGQGQKHSYFLTPEIVDGFSPELPEYGKITQKERNLLAQKLLKEAGYRAENPLTFSLLYNTDNKHKKIALAISAMWKKSLDVNVTLDNQEWKTYLATRQEGDFQVARGAWCGDYNEASTFTSLMISSNVNGGKHYKSKAYDKLIDAAQNAKTDKERAKIYYQQEALLTKDMPLAPIYQEVTTRLVNPRIGGYATKNPEDRVFSKDIY